MGHAHEYRFWHAHTHGHISEKSLRETEFHSGTHDWHGTGHYHLWAQTHDHGSKPSLWPHTHKDKQFHPADDLDEKHHHAPADHDEDEKRRTRAAMVYGNDHVKTMLILEAEEDER